MAEHARALVTRRTCLTAAALLPLAGRAVEVAPWLREGGLVIAFRHALAPGTFDPPGFQLGDCRTQRNLNDEGRAQARRIGDWFRQRQLQPAAVRASPWCRCLETATLAFGQAQPWGALGSPHEASEASRAQQQAQLGQALRELSARPGRLEVWVTHMFVLADLAQVNTATGEGLILRAGTAGGVQLLGRIATA